MLWICSQVNDFGWFDGEHAHTLIAHNEIFTEPWEHKRSEKLSTQRLQLSPPTLLDLIEPAIAGMLVISELAQIALVQNAESGWSSKHYPREQKAFTLNFDFQVLAVEPQ